MDNRQQALIDKFDARVEQTEAKIDLLRARAKEAGADQRIKLDEKIQDLEAKKNQLQGRLRELRNASGEAWKDIADGAERAWDSLTDAVNRAVSRFS